MAQAQSKGRTQQKKSERTQQTKSERAELALDETVAYDESGNKTGNIRPLPEESAVIYQSTLGQQSYVEDYGWPTVESNGEVKPKRIPFAVKLRLGALSQENILRMVPTGAMYSGITLRDKIVDAMAADEFSRDRYTFSWELRNEDFIVEKAPRRKADAKEILLRNAASGKLKGQELEDVIAKLQALANSEG